MPVRRRLHDGDVLAVGHLTLEVVALRGHTPGSVALAYREPVRPSALLGADSCRAGSTCSPATACSPAGSAAPRATPSGSGSCSTTSSERVFDRFDDSTWVYPGHGRDTTLGAERPHLAEWRERGW